MMPHMNATMETPLLFTAKNSENYYKWNDKYFDNMWGNINNIKKTLNVMFNILCYSQ
jgi:hypothetical protein